MKFIVLALLLALIGIVGASFFDFTVPNLEGDELSLSSFKDNKVILVVNVASACGYTHRNYQELQPLYERHKRQGFTVLAFPCNQFGAQEPGSSSDILDFVTSRYSVTFPMLGKVEVNGPGAHPVFKFLKAASGDPTDIPWNFSKFLVVNGQPVARYSHGTNPSEIEADIVEALLAGDGSQGEL